jgi:hypothetical protein
MSRARIAKRIAIYAILILLGTLISTSLLGSRAAGESPAAVAPQLEPGPASPSAETWTNCTPLNVAAYSNRIHVKCVETVGGIQWFAASTANAANAARILSLLSTAQAAGRTLSILYDPDDTSGTSIGCAATDCRLLHAAAILQ